MRWRKWKIYTGYIYILELSASQKHTLHLDLGVFSTMPSSSFGRGHHLQKQICPNNIISDPFRKANTYNIYIYHM
jgi:hypothetical protein